MLMITKRNFFSVLFAMLIVAVVVLTMGWRYRHPDYQQTLNFPMGPYALLTKDLDGNGSPDVVLVSHGENQATVWLQKEKRQFGIGVRSESVGFHPGFMLSWPDRSDVLLGAEGENEIRQLALDENGSLIKTAAMPGPKAVELQRFQWPGWGESLVVRPYLQDELVLLRQFNPDTLTYSHRQVLPMSSQRPSLLVPGRLTVLDADRDGVDEIYYGLGVVRQLRRLVYPGPDKPLERSELVAKLTSGHPQEILTADFNQDSYPDLLVPDSLPNGWLHVFMNDGKGQFNEVPLPNLLPRQELQGFALARDHDGSLLLLINATRQLHLLRFPEKWVGDAAQIQLRSVPKPAAEASVIASLTDLDQDGWLDAIASLDRPKDSTWLCYGPLWENFADLNRRGFVLD